MANKQRGEVTIVGPKGERYTLCLTLGAIAEIEENLNISNLTEVGEAMKKPSARSLISLLLPLLHGGGHADLDRKDMMLWDVNLKEVVLKIQECFKAAGFGNDEEEEPSGN